MHFVKYQCANYIIINPYNYIFIYSVGGGGKFLLATRIMGARPHIATRTPVDPDINLFPANTPPFDNMRAETIAQ